MLTGATATPRRIRQDDEEFFASISRQRIVRSQGFADNVRKMHECVVAGLVAVGIVEPLEVVYVQQCEADWSLTTLRAGQFAIHCFLEALAVERAGKLVVAHHFARFSKLILQSEDFLLGILDACLQGIQVVARSLCVELNDPRLTHNLFYDVIQFGKIVGSTDFLMIASTRASGRGTLPIGSVGMVVMVFGIGP